jgi:toxin CcdB
MRQFVVYQNRSPSRKFYPLLLNMQSDLISASETRLGVPLYPLGKTRSPMIERAAPIVEVDGVKYVLMMPLVAGVSIGNFGREVVDLSRERAVILDALDFLTHGI